MIGKTPKQQADARAATGRKMKALGAMVRDQRLNETDLRVAFLIIDHMNVKCRSFPGHLRISKEIGRTRQTVVRSTARLETFGYFDIAKGGGRGKSNSYTLTRETVRDDGEYKKKPRSAESVRGLKQKCPSPRTKTVRDDGQEPFKEPLIEPLKGGRAASPPNGDGAPLKKEEYLHELAATYIPREDDDFDEVPRHILIMDGLRAAGFEDREAWGFLLDNLPPVEVAA